MTIDAAYLARFTNAPHERLAAFAAQSPRIDDLALTHPLAFAALAMGFGGDARNAAAVAAVLEGQRLRVVCDIAGIPLCLRSIAPEFCPAPWPHAEWSADVSTVLARWIPGDPAVLIDWLPAVFFAHGAAGEAFAMWVAKRHKLFSERGLHHRRLLSLALYAWFSDHPELELGRLVPDPWSFKTGTNRMLEGVRTWLNRIVCRTYLPGDGGSSRHVAYDRIGPFLVFALTDYRHILDEQQVMSNCLDRYGRRLSSGTHRMFSLRSVRGARIATFEVNMQSTDGSALHEIKGTSNNVIPDRITRAVANWADSMVEVLSRSGTVSPLRCEPHDRTTEAERRCRELMGPYVAAHATALKNADIITLYSLEEGLTKVAQKFGITNWPAYFAGKNHAPFL